MRDIEKDLKECENEVKKLERKNTELLVIMVFLLGPFTLGGLGKMLGFY